MTISASSTRPNDVYYMSLAVAEAKKGRYTTRPNPAVGCVLVKDDCLLATGFHKKAGEPHAEIVALNSARSQGHTVALSTAYVTLEPCSHFGRTPPCALALIEADIKRVVIAGLDPNPKVAGRGVAMLQHAGIEVTVGVLQTQAQTLNVGFLKAMRTGRPHVRLKIATSLDGRTAMASGESKWITGTHAREDVQKLRAISGAIITGSQTVIDDNPSLNVRSTQLGITLSDVPQPQVVILDRRQRLRNEQTYQVLQRDDTLLWHEDNLQTLLEILVSKHQVYDALVEAGATVAGSFMQQNLVDELIIYQAPCILGKSAKPMLNVSLDKLSEQYRLMLHAHDQVGEDLKITLLKP